MLRTNLVATTLSSIQLVLLYISTSYAKWDQQPNNFFNKEFNAKQFPTRLFELMRTYYEDANLRILEFTHMRFMYEESPHYEQGYVIHEIVEKYRKMVELVQRQHGNDVYVIGMIERMQAIQKLYFEIYHLVNMHHEITIKWRIKREFDDRNSQSDQEARIFLDAQKAFEEAAKIREREQKQRLKQLQKARNQKWIDLLNGITPQPHIAGAKPQPYNKLWPIDYGWEINRLPWFDGMPGPT